VSGDEVLDALVRQPGGSQLVTLAQHRDDVAIVGGAVRDLLLGQTPRELDVIVDGDAISFAGDLAALLAAQTVEHERFGTASVQWEAGRVDVALRRRESYAAPGALPQVVPGSVSEDLQRRDFTVNAIAVALGGESRGELQSVEYALDDLHARRLRVLHERSFLDDPTRLLRLARYSARLGFDFEHATAQLAAHAVAAGALQTVSLARIGTELRLALAEPDAVAALDALNRLDVLSAIASELRFDAPLTRRALELLPEDGRPDLLIMGATLLASTAEPHADAAAALRQLLDGLQFSAGERDVILAVALDARKLAARLQLPSRPSQLRRLLCREPIEAVALAGAPAAAGDAAAGRRAAGEWLDHHRHVRLAISGEDLLAAGVPAGPEVGARLQAALDRKLDGELDLDRDAELNAALEASA
jgi:tRNA nucleotidyltransferase (CCA-adding enzyme)